LWDLCEKRDLGDGGGEGLSRVLAATRASDTTNREESREMERGEVSEERERERERERESNARRSKTEE
jgi:hypothetical protein